MNEKLVQASMNIILNAGDAREENLQALKAIAEGDIEKAKKYHQLAGEKITIAHKAQTDQIQDETRGETKPYSVLFAHAQDTLMTINSEIILVNQLIEVFDSYNTRLNKLEEKLANL